METGLDAVGDDARAIGSVNLNILEGSRLTYHSPIHFFSLKRLLPAHCSRVAYPTSVGSFQVLFHTFEDQLRRAHHSL